MTTLGAKPNHGFFNCQHPAPGNPRERVRCSRRTRPAARACAYRHACARRAHASVPSDQNIFFSAVSCFTRETSTEEHSRRGRHGGHAGARRNGGERRLHFFSSSGRFSAPHNPDCAKLREPFGGVRRRSTHAGATTTRMFGQRTGRRIGTTGDLRDARSMHAMIGMASPCRHRVATFASPTASTIGGAQRRSSAASATDERHDARRIRLPETKKPPAFPRTASGCARSGAMSRCDQCSSSSSSSA